MQRPMWVTLPSWSWLLSSLLSSSSSLADPSPRLACCCKYLRSPKQKTPSSNAPAARNNQHSNKGEKKIGGKTVNPRSGLRRHPGSMSSPVNESPQWSPRNLNCHKSNPRTIRTKLNFFFLLPQREDLRNLFRFPALLFFGVFLVFCFWTVQFFTRAISDWPIWGNQLKKSDTNLAKTTAIHGTSTTTRTRSVAYTNDAIQYSVPQRILLCYCLWCQTILWVHRVPSTCWILIHWWVLKTSCFHFPQYSHFLWSERKCQFRQNFLVLQHPYFLVLCPCLWSQVWK